MLYRRIGTDLLYNVTNPDLVPLYEGNEAYEVVETKKEEPAVEKKAAPRKNTKK